jgi:hypothetical protein
MRVVNMTEEGGNGTMFRNVDGNYHLRTQARSDSKTVERVSGRAGDTRDVVGFIFHYTSISINRK